METRNEQAAALSAMERLHELTTPLMAARERVFVGVDLLMNGWTFAMFAFALRDATRRIAPV